jgi:hypothetical protein
MVVRTMNAIQRPDATQIVRAAVRDHFPGAPIVGIRVRPDTDHDGDPVLEIFVVVDGDPVQTLRGGFAEMTTLLRDRLVQAGIEHFPMTRYLSRHSAERMAVVAG